MNVSHAYMKEQQSATIYDSILESYILQYDSSCDSLKLGTQLPYWDMKA